MYTIEEFKNLNENEMIAEVERLDHLYYTEDSPDICDDDYDQMKLILTDRCPEYINVGSSPDSTFEKVRHDDPMLSLDKVHAKKIESENKLSLQKMLSFVEKTRGIACDFKIDGLSLELEYVNGNLFRASTRGDGTIGEDVTENAKKINDIPKKINYTGDVRVRGEVYAKISIFNKTNSNLSDGEKFKNARCYASGSLRQKDSSITKERNLSFFAYYVLGANVKKQKDEILFLKEMGFKTPESFTFGKKDFNLASLSKIIQYFSRKRASLDFLIDGVVFKAFYFSDRERLGENEKFPKWALVWKFLPVEKKTPLLDVEFTVGKTGIVTPCGIIEPVEIDGSIVSHPSLHNRRQMERLGLKIGSIVTVCKAGDVIPYISHAEGGHRDIEYPEFCPCCASKLIYEEIYIKCVNPKCKEKLIGKIQVMVESLGIEEFGDSTRRLVVEKGLVKNVFDIFDLTKEQILKLDGFKERSASKLIENIQRSDKTPVRLLTGLVIPGVSKTTFGKLLGVSDVNCLVEDIKSGSLEKYSKIVGIGDFVVSSLRDYGKENPDVLDGLVSFYKASGTSVSTKLRGISFAITGALSVPRKEIEKKIELSGGKVGGINKNTNYLICNEASSSSKFEKAKEYGIAVISEDDFLKMLG